jgi:cell wall-associated NlpC family hydrolase
VIAGVYADIPAVVGFRLLLVIVLALTAGACAARSTGTTAGGPVPRPFPGAPLPPRAEAPPPVAAPPVATVPPGTLEPAETGPRTLPIPTLNMPEVVTTALSLRGTPYRYGGSDLSGFDCSGFVQWVFAQHGTRLPREVRDQFKYGEDVEEEDIQAGDLVFFETVSRGASHVGMAIGGDQFVHAPSSTGVVRVERLTSSYWGQKFVGARRVAPSTGTP